MPAVPAEARCMGSLLWAGVAADRTQPPTQPARNPPMPKKTLAAALAAVVLLPLLVFVDLPAAQAHEKTTRYCTYDPISNTRHCWDAPIAHTHRVIPDNPPPDTSPKPPRCPAGTTGTPPDCSPVPPDNTNRLPETTTTTTEAPKSCPPGQHSNGGAGRNCHAHSFTPPCGTGTWSPGHGHSPIQRPPCSTTTTTQPEPKCIWPNHAHGSTCHGWHGEPPCGTGTWSPGHGHTPVQRPPCSTTTTTQPADCEASEHRHTLGARRNRGGGTTSTCHAASASHCGAGNMHEHVHGSQECHEVDPGGGSGWSRHHCADGQHQHEHNASPCHSLRIAHCDGEGQHAHELTLPSGGDMSHWCHSASALHCGANEHYHDGLGCHSTSADNCPAGQHEHVASVSLGCHDPSIVHHSAGPLQSAISLLELGICGPLHFVRNWTGPALVEGCKGIHDQLRKDAQERADKKNQEHDETVTTEGPPPPTTEPPLSDAEARRLLDQIERDFQARKINANEANEAANRIRCRQGHWSCRR